MPPPCMRRLAVILVAVSVIRTCLFRIEVIDEFFEALLLGVECMLCKRQKGAETDKERHGMQRVPFFEGLLARIDCPVERIHPFSGGQINFLSVPFGYVLKRRVGLPLAAAITRRADGCDKQVFAEKIFVIPYRAAVGGILKCKRAKHSHSALIGYICARVEIGPQPIAQKIILSDNI